MDFTREPIIETVITPREGAKLVVRSSKTVGQEEYFVDSVEVVSFGNAIFFRSTEKPKAFLLPTSDFEVLEVREARIVLKNVGIDRSIKIAGGRDVTMRAPKETSSEEKAEAQPSAQENTELKQERKKDRRRHGRRRRGRDEAFPVAEGEEAPERSEEAPSSEVAQVPVFSPLLTPPPLISETISRYKEQFKDAFYTKEEESAFVQGEEFSETALPEIPLMQPAFGSFENTEEDEEEIYRQRKRRLSLEAESLEPEQPTEEKKPEESEPTV